MAAASREAAVEPVGKKILVNGINIQYYDWGGRGPNVVFLHGSSGYGHIWDFTARPLHSKYRILALDQRGHGDSDKPPTGHAGEDYAADLAAFVDALGIAPFTLAGNSLGGRVGMIYSALHPDKVSHLVLVGGPHYVSLFSDPKEVAQSKENAEAMRRSRQGFPSEEEALKRLSARYSAWGEEALRHTLRYNTNRMPDGSLVWKFDKDIVADTLSHIPDNLTSYVKRIKCPVLFAVPEHDRDLTPERQRRAEGVFSNVVSVRIPNCAYTPPMENPTALAKIIDDFLATRRPG